MIDKFRKLGRDLMFDPLGTLLDVALWLILFGLGLWFVIWAGKWVWNNVIQGAS